MSGKKTDTSILFADEVSEHSNSIASYLKAAGYRLTRVTSWQEATVSLASQNPDVIMAPDNHDSHRFFDTIRQTYTNRPLLVLLSHSTKRAHNGQRTADLMLPPQPDLIAHQLPYILSLRDENHVLRRQNKHLSDKLDTISTRLQQDEADAEDNQETRETLEIEITTLKDEIASQRRASGEIEILKNAIVRNVSHELKTPLLQVKSAVSLLSEDPGNQNLIAYALNATARLETHVKNITMLGNSLDIKPNPIIIRDAIEYARRNLSRVWERRREAERIKINIEDKLPPIMADKQGLSTVLQLLMDNALKFSEENITVKAALTETGKTVRVEVCDRGIGIDEGQLDAIFETFYQIDSASTRRYGGTGVGLALVRLILDHHDISIHVRSKRNHGSTFWFELPVVSIEDANKAIT